MTAFELRVSMNKLGIPSVLLANLCLVETWEVEAWRMGRRPIPSSVDALLARMRSVSRTARYRVRDQS
jgi:hypothetical protein